MTHSLTPTEQQQVDAAVTNNCVCTEMDCAHSKSFRRGITFALDHLFASRMEKFAEWVSLKGLYQEIDLKWNDKFGGKVRLVAETTADLWALYEKYQERLKQQQDEQSEKGS